MAAKVIEFTTSKPTQKLPALTFRGGIRIRVISQPNGTVRLLQVPNKGDQK